MCTPRLSPVGSYISIIVVHDSDELLSKPYSLIYEVILVRKATPLELPEACAENSDIAVIL